MRDEGKGVGEGGRSKNPHSRAQRLARPLLRGSRLRSREKVDEGREGNERFVRKVMREKSRRRRRKKSGTMLGCDAAEVKGKGREEGVRDEKSGGLYSPRGENQEAKGVKESSSYARESREKKEREGYLETSSSSGFGGLGGRVDENAHCCCRYDDRCSSSSGDDGGRSNGRYSSSAGGEGGGYY